VSPGGRDVALVDGTLSFASQGRATTNVDVVTAKGAHGYRFAGNLDPEAFSTDGRTLFVLDFLPAMEPSRYSVRAVDLATGRIRAVPDQDGSVRASMPGYAQAQVMSPDGTHLFTFYASYDPISGADGDQYHAWIHVLNLEHTWAHCLELDVEIGVGGAATAALAVSADGKRLYVSDRTSGALVAIDTQTLRTIRTRFVRELANDSSGSVLAADGNTLFVNASGGGLTRVDARTLEPEAGVVAQTASVTAMQVDHSGALYLLAAQGLFVIDSRGRPIERWDAPGDAMTIAPQTAPGRGTYQCAC
jgi:DNA-binding beta-propeller fold protein YncE